MHYGPAIKPPETTPVDKDSDLKKAYVGTGSMQDQI